MIWWRVPTGRSGEIGRHKGLRIPRSGMMILRVRVPPAPQKLRYYAELYFDYDHVPGSGCGCVGFCEILENLQ